MTSQELGLWFGKYWFIFLIIFIVLKLVHSKKKYDPKRRVRN